MEVTQRLEQRITKEMVDEMANEKLALLEEGKITIADTDIETIIKAPTSGYILEKKIDVGDPIVPLTSYQAGNCLVELLLDDQGLNWNGDSASPSQTTGLTNLVYFVLLSVPGEYIVPTLLESAPDQTLNPRFEVAVPIARLILFHAAERSDLDSRHQYSDCPQ